MSNACKSHGGGLEVATAVCCPSGEHSGTAGSVVRCRGGVSPARTYDLDRPISPAPYLELDVYVWLLSSNPGVTRGPHALDMSLPVEAIPSAVITISTLPGSKG